MADKDISIVQQNASAKWVSTTVAPTMGQHLGFDASKNLVATTRWSVSSDRGDTSPTLSNFTDSIVQRFATTLTGNRTVTLPTSNNYNGAFFRIVRTGLGAFTLDVGGLKTIPSATAAFVDVVHDGTAWRLAGYGTL